jgi:iron complex transport system substrate-binding protein
VFNKSKNSISIKLIALLGAALMLFYYVLPSTNIKKSDDTTFRLISAYKPATSIVLALGAEDYLVGIHGRPKSNKVIQSLYDKSDYNLTNVGGRKSGYNIESIIALEPDLIILPPMDESEILIQKLKEFDINYLCINPESVESLKSSILEIGKSINRIERAKTLVTFFNKYLDKIQSRISGSFDKKRVYIAGPYGYLSTISQDLYQHEMIELAGGRDVSSHLNGSWNEISIEELIKQNPEIVFSVPYMKPDVNFDSNDFAKSKIIAYQNQAIYKIPSSISSWDTPEPQSILGIIWMSKKIYPDLFSDIDMIELTNGFYNEFYGKSFQKFGGSLDEIK